MNFARLILPVSCLLLLEPPDPIPQSNFYSQALSVRSPWFPGFWPHFQTGRRFRAAVVSVLLIPAAFSSEALSPMPSSQAETGHNLVKENLIRDAESVAERQAVAEFRSLLLDDLLSQTDKSKLLHLPVFFGNWPIATSGPFVVCKTMELAKKEPDGRMTRIVITVLNQNVWTRLTQAQKSFFAWHEETHILGQLALSDRIKSVTVEVNRKIADLFLPPQQNTAAFVDAALRAFDELKSDDNAEMRFRNQYKEIPYDEVGAALEVHRKAERAKLESLISDFIDSVRPKDKTEFRNWLVPTLSPGRESHQVQEVSGRLRISS